MVVNKLINKFSSHGGSDRDQGIGSLMTRRTYETRTMSLSEYVFEMPSSRVMPTIKNSCPCSQITTWHELYPSYTLPSSMCAQRESISAEVRAGLFVARLLDKMNVHTEPPGMITVTAEGEALSSAPLSRWKPLLDGRGRHRRSPPPG